MHSHIYAGRYSCKCVHGLMRARIQLTSISIFIACQFGCQSNKWCHTAACESESVCVCEREREEKRDKRREKEREGRETSYREFLLCCSSGSTMWVTLMHICTHTFSLSLSLARTHTHTHANLGTKCFPKEPEEKTTAVTGLKKSHLLCLFVGSSAAAK